MMTDGTSACDYRWSNVALVLKLAHCWNHGLRSDITLCFISEKSLARLDLIRHSFEHVSRMCNHVFVSIAGQHTYAAGSCSISSQRC